MSSDNWTIETVNQPTTYIGIGTTPLSHNPFFLRFLTALSLLRSVETHELTILQERHFAFCDNRFPWD